MAESADTASAVAPAAELTGATPTVAPSGSGFSVNLGHANEGADILIGLDQELRIGQVASSPSIVIWWLAPMCWVASNRPKNGECNTS